MDKSTLCVALLPHAAGFIGIVAHVIFAFWRENLGAAGHGSQVEGGRGDWEARASGQGPGKVRGREGGCVFLPLTEVVS